MSAHSSSVNDSFRNGRGHRMQLREPVSDGRKNAIKVASISAPTGKNSWRKAIAKPDLEVSNAPGGRLATAVIVPRR
jgi:hypothetical protein